MSLTIFFAEVKINISLQIIAVKYTPVAHPFFELFKSKFNDYTPYDLKKVISSLAIHEGDT